MSKVFVVPDVHLKPWIFEKASELIYAGSYEGIVMLGDIVDDWFQQSNIDLYNKTFDTAIDFAAKHPETLWCYGNHDVSYLWEAWETGYSEYARETVMKRIEDLRNAVSPGSIKFMHRIDNTLFSHAGLTESFVMRYFGVDNSDIDSLIAEINKMGSEELWEEDSPIWARPQYGDMTIFPDDMFQVVGHTPARGVLHEGNLLTLDDFSTYRDGTPIGDERFVWVDTVEKKWGYADA